MTLTELSAYAATDVGVVRDHNEDAVVAGYPLFAVADGMGGHAAGEVASSIALRTLQQHLGDVSQESIVAGVHAANRAILEYSAAHPETAGMGTTVTGVALGEVGGSPHWFVFNVGDSRVYQLAGNELRQATTDHSEVEELVSLGQLTPDQALVYPRRNVVTRSLGSDPAPDVDVWTYPAVPGEIFLACSDGLPLEVSDERIGHILRFCPLAEAATALVAAAVSAGARDNVSAVVVSIPVTSEPDQDAETTAPRRLITKVGE